METQKHHKYIREVVRPYEPTEQPQNSHWDENKHADSGQPLPTSLQKKRHTKDTSLKAKKNNKLSLKKQI